MRALKIGIFGGTFAPPHKTHIEIVNRAIKTLRLDKVFVIPCGIPPHKDTDTSLRHRLAMTKLAFEDGKKVFVDNYEALKEGSSFTYGTVEHYKKMYPDDQLYLLMGGDSFAQFDNWKNPEIIAKMTTLVVAERMGIEFTLRAGDFMNKYIGASLIRLDFDSTYVSSTRIRIDYQFGLIPNQFVTRSVDQYICYNGLYSHHKRMVEGVRGLLNESRFEHTYYTVVKGLSLPHSLNRDKVFIACLLHDCAKFVKPNEYEKYHFTPPDNIAEKIIHQYLGVEVARRRFNVTDTDILNAIRYHTTGRANMSDLEKVVYVADKTEETRPYKTKHLMADTLEQTFINVLDEATKKRRTQHTDLDPDSQAAVAFYLSDKDV